MAVPQVNDQPAYIIYRDVPAGEPYDATSPLSFFPPKGSDELFDALRLSFPLLRTHSERMRDAIIQFLLEERQVEQFELSPANALESSQLTWPSVSSASTSNFSSPDLLNYATPVSFTNSPQVQQAQQPCIATSTQSSSPSLDQMTGVFSLSSGPQPKQRVRRKMTDAEKIEYRKRRIVKACDKCAKRKRKCPHNQAKMETLPTPTISTKSNSPQSTETTQPPSQPSIPSFPKAFDGSFDPSSFGSFDDFNMFDDDPLAEVSVDDFFNFEHFEDTTIPFNNTMHDHFAPAQLVQPHGVAAQGARHNDRPLSRRVSASDRGADRLIHSQVSPPLVCQTATPETQAQVCPPMVGRTATPEAQAQVSPPLVCRSAIPEAQAQAYDTPSQYGADSLLSRSRTPSNSAENQPGRKNADPLGSSNTVQRPNHGQSMGSRAGLLPEPTSTHEGCPLRLRSTGSSSRRGLTWTSASLLSGPSALESAIPQGKPEPARLTETSVQTEQPPSSNEGGRRQMSSGGGLRRSDSLATELFMLRRRLPAMRRPAIYEKRDDVASVVTAQRFSINERVQQCPEQLSTQANGGPYQQRGSGISRSVHARAQDAAARGTANPLMLEAKGASCNQNVVPDMFLSSTAGPIRKADHVRFRDHHGRQKGLALPQLAIAVGAFALVAMFSPGPTALCLALLLMTHSFEATDNSARIVKCTSKNSSWLSAFLLRSRSDVVLRSLKTRQYVRGGDPDAGIRMSKAGPDAWLCGSMDSFRSAWLTTVI